MNKTKVKTIIVCITIFVYAVLSELLFKNKINNLYLYVINPIFWALMAIALKIMFGDKYINKRKEKRISLIAFLGVAIYIIIYVISGIVLTFGNNPYSTTLRGICINLWIFGVPLIMMEYVRYLVINSVNFSKNKKLVAIAISIIYVFIDFEIIVVLRNNITAFYIVKRFAQILLPSIVRNILYSYICIKFGYKPNLIYQLGINLYIWVSPVLPNLEWVMISIINIFVPLVLLLYVRYENFKSSFRKSKADIKNSNPSGTIPFIAVVILAVWFAIGVFPIKPVSIATPSMEKELYVGDVAIIKKCNPNDVKVGDIIEYQMKGYTVIHRIVQKNQRNGEFYFITKGDNNKDPDAFEVTEDQLIGKVIFKIRYIGYPAIWFHKWQEKQQIQVETGN